VNDQNKRLVADYYQKLYSPQYKRAIADHLSAKYVEHQYTAHFSRQGLSEYVGQRLAENPGHQVIIHKTLAQDDRVFLFVEEKLDSGEDIARAELFRLSDGKIVEHWGSHVVDEKNRKNTNGTFDGPLPDPKTDYGQRFLADFLELDVRAFDGQEIDCFYLNRTPDYKQHSPKGGDGIEGLVTILSKAKANGIKVSMTAGQTLVENDFVVCHRLYDTVPKHPLMNRINTFDIFRLNAEGKAVEHWDVMEDVPDESMISSIF
jgi:predicted SnoaL-like aldol condensation-catalyzing enzyme